MFDIKEYLLYSIYDFSSFRNAMLYLFSRARKNEFIENKLIIILKIDELPTKKEYLNKIKKLYINEMKKDWMSNNLDIYMYEIYSGIYTYYNYKTLYSDSKNNILIPEEIINIIERRKYFKYIKIN